MIGWDEDIKKKLGRCGQNVFIGKYCTIVYPELLFLGDNVRIDPHCHITTRLEMAGDNFVGAHCIFSGGAVHKITFGKGSFMGYNSELYCASEDYSGEFGMIGDCWFENKIDHGDIEFKDYGGIASGVMVWPGVTIPEGCAIGARSMVRRKDYLVPWSVYWGNPLQLHKTRPHDPPKIKLKDRWL